MSSFPNEISVVFDVQELYYLPQYLPIHCELLKRGQIDTCFVFYRGQFDAVVQKIIEAENLNYHWVKNKSEANSLYQAKKADWVFFSNTFSFLDDVHTVSKSAQIGHGIGAKASYYNQSDSPTTVRFVEGEHKTNRLRSMYPNNKFINAGFSKLDPIFNGETCGLDLDSLKLDPSKKNHYIRPYLLPQ